MGSRFLLPCPPRHVVKYLPSWACLLPCLPRSALGRSLQTLPRALQRVLLPTPPRRVQGWPGGRGGVDPRAQHPTAVHGSEPAGPGPPLLREGCGLGRLASLEMRFRRTRAAVLTAEFRFLTTSCRSRPPRNLLPYPRPSRTSPTSALATAPAAPAPPPGMRG